MEIGAETSAYRNPAEGLRAEREELLAIRHREAEGIPLAVIDVYARRFARVVAGLAGVATALLGAGMVAAGIDAPRFVTPIAIAAVVATYVVARARGRARIRRYVSEEMLHEPPFATVRRMADAHEPWSIVLAAAAITLLLPMALESLFLAGGASFPSDWRQRMALAECSSVLIALATMAILWSRNVRMQTVQQLMDVYRGSVAEAWTTAILVSAGWAMIAACFRLMQPGEGPVGMAVFWGILGTWLLLAAVAAPVFAILYRRVEAERATLGLTADDFLRRRP